jgi:hypothetical protein
LPDDRAKADAAFLRQEPPAALVYVDLPEIVWTEHERAFRQGRPLGQREILSAIHDWINSDRYDHRLTRDLGNGCTLHVWTLASADPHLAPPGKPAASTALEAAELVAFPSRSRDTGASPP